MRLPAHGTELSRTRPYMLDTKERRICDFSYDLYVRVREGVNAAAVRRLDGVLRLHAAGSRPLLLSVPRLSPPLERIEAVGSRRQKNVNELNSLLNKAGMATRLKALHWVRVARRRRLHVSLQRKM